MSLAILLKLTTIAFRAVKTLPTVKVDIAFNYQG